MLLGVLERMVPIVQSSSRVEGPERSFTDHNTVRRVLHVGAQWAKRRYLGRL